MSAPPLPAENVYGHTKKLRFVLDVVRRVREEAGREVSLLDFGCGNGSAVSRFLMLPGVRYHGVDVHGPSLEYARAHFGREGAVFHDRVPEGVEFDVIVYADVLEHLDDPAGVLREHARVLASGGVVVGAVPNGWGPFENEKRLDALLGISRAMRLGGRVRRALLRRPPRAGEAIPYNLDSGHVQFYTRRSLRETLERGGFRMETLVNGAFVGAPLSERFLLRGTRVAELNARVADRLPHWAVSTWYFTARKT